MLLPFTIPIVIGGAHSKAVATVMITLSHPLFLPLGTLLAPLGSALSKRDHDRTLAFAALLPGICDQLDWVVHAEKSNILMKIFHQYIRASPRYEGVRKLASARGEIPRRSVIELEFCSQGNAISMNNIPNLNSLSAFVLIAKLRSFRKAADELGVAPSTLSHLIRSLESESNVRLLNRTTRSVSLTEAGEALFAGLTPVLRDLNSAFEALDQFASSRSGELRISATETSVRILMENVVPTFLKRYPGLSLTIGSEGRLVDIVQFGFDAGIRLSDFVELDMHRVHFGSPLRFHTVASPKYISEQGLPLVPMDLEGHDCIRVRYPKGRLMRWHFKKGKKVYTHKANGRLMVDHAEMIAEAAMAGWGIAYLSNYTVEKYIESGKLISMLDDWLPESPGFSLYYPGDRHISPALRAFIDVLKEVLPYRPPESPRAALGIVR